MSRRERRKFTEEFKKKIIQLHLSGKTRKDILAEYDLTGSTFDTWLKQSKTTGSFKAKDNRTQEEEELIKLRKENQQLKMENDIS